VRAQSSPAPLRLAIEPIGAQRVAVDVFKRRGPPMAAPLVLTLPGPALLPGRRARRVAPPVERPQADDIRRPPPEGVQQSGQATFA